MTTSAGAKAASASDEAAQHATPPGQPTKAAFEGPAQSDRLLRHLLWPLRVAVALGLVYFVGRWLDFGAIGQAWGQARRVYLLAALALLIPNLAFQGLRWWEFVKLLKPRCSFGECLKSLLAGSALAVGTPGRLGEFGRAWWIRGDFSHWALAGLSFLDKYYTFSVVLVSGTVSLLCLAAFRAVLGPYGVLASILLAALAGVLFVVLLWPTQLGRVVGVMRRTLPHWRPLWHVADGLGRFTPPAARRAMFWTVLYFVVFLAQFHLLLNAFAAHSPLVSIRVISGTTLFKSVLPISFGGLGIAEVSAVKLMKIIGGNPVAAFNASLLLFLNILIPAACGLPIVLGLRAKPSREG